MRRSMLPVVLALLFAAPDARALALDPNFAQTELPGTGGIPVTGTAWAPDGSQRLFLTTKDGNVRIVEDGVLLPTPFMSVAELYQGSECGLLSVAFDPNFGENGYVYFFMTVSASEQRIVRYRAAGNVGVEPTIIVAGLPTLGANHDGGALAFGPDGKLYWAIGDLGPGTGVDDDLQSLAAKVGRVNRDGTVPLDNPFHDNGGPNDDRIWARGFRNPFTMTFRPTTGDLWLNVVGTYFEQVFVVDRGAHGGWNDHEQWQPDGFLEPVITYPTNGIGTYTLAPEAGSAVRSSGVTTFTTTSRHWLHPGEQVTLSGVADPSFDGKAFVVATPTETTFTVTQSGPDATSSNGSMTTTELGGCITGGVFYDSTAGSGSYRDNFFFSDFNSGQVMRVRLSGNGIRAVEPWANGHPAAVDISLGPDGDLYVATYGGIALQRYAFRSTLQYVVVSPTNVWMLEDGVAAFHVRLSMAPTSDIDVRVGLSSSSSTLSVTRGETLTFGPSDWSTPKPVSLASVRDADTLDEVVSVAVATAGMPTETVRVRITDEYAAVEPPPGGAGGEAGTTGESGAGGLGGIAGEGPGDTGSDVGGSDSGTGGSARGGSSAEGGRADGGEVNEPKGGDEADGGCGCRMSRRSGGGVAVLVLALSLLRRRTGRRARRA